MSLLISYYVGSNNDTGSKGSKIQLMTRLILPASRTIVA